MPGNGIILTSPPISNLLDFSRKFVFLQRKQKINLLPLKVRKQMSLSGRCLLERNTERILQYG